MSVFRVFRIETFNDENLFEQNFNELLRVTGYRAFRFANTLAPLGFDAPGRPR
jgi:hypothetical protein